MTGVNQNEQAANVAPAASPAAPWGNDSAPSLPSVDSFENHTEADETDSAVGGLSIQSSTVSLRSSIYDHVEENGRTYHRFREGSEFVDSSSEEFAHQSEYMLPNDEQEQERLDIQHGLFTITLRGLHLAPIGSEPKNVLDIATGTGLWATEFAHQYPSSRVLGTDLSAIQPLYVPPNCRFEIDDAEDEWNFSEKFDYIHGRALLSCFKDPKYVLQQAYDSLAPGGYFELQDMVFPFQFLGDPPTDSPLYKWFEIITEGAAKLGRPWTNVQYYKGWFEEIGFEEIVEKKYYWPINPWAKGSYYKDISVYAQADFLSGLEGLSLKIMGLMGYSADEVREFLVGVKEDVKSTDVHCYCPMRVVYGRKPGVQSRHA